jgi:uncharacterized protein YcfJ
MYVCIRFGEINMDKSMINGLVIGAVVATAGGAIASYTMLRDKPPEYAMVVSVEEVKETVSTPREVCEDVAVTKKAPVKDEHKIAGTAIGAVAGGLLGNQIGGGSDKVQGNMQDKDTYTTTERRCQTVTDTSENVIGYDVTYMLGDTEGTVRMNEKPGIRIPVENGQLVLD